MKHVNLALRDQAYPVALSLRTDPSVRWDEATGYVHHMFIAVDLGFAPPGTRWVTTSADRSQSGDFLWVPPRGPRGILRSDFYHATLFTASLPGGHPRAAREIAQVCQDHWQTLGNLHCFSLVFVGFFWDLKFVDNFA